MDLMKHMHELVPFRIGHAVKINPAFRYADDWKGTFVVVGLQWDYQKGDGTGINISIASDEEIEGRYGWTDGFTVDDLLPA